LLETAIEAAQRAGRLIAERYPRERNAAYKAYRDLVTETDIAAEKTILNLIQKRFPDHGVLSEEASGGGIDEGYTWVIDPLDGTSNYTHRIPTFAVSIAVVERGEPRIGVVYDPMREHLFAAERGDGASLNGQALEVSGFSELRESIVGFDWARDEETRQGVLGKLNRLAPHCHTMRAMGSASLGLTYVAAGWLDGYFHLALHPWDSAAAVVLAVEAGGRCSTLDGRPYSITSPDCAVTNGRIHDELLDVLHRS
jgi:myo-inositol-1(or 4)-monophosphatase